jgi:hypothetical protein
VALGNDGNTRQAVYARRDTDATAFISIVEHARQGSVTMDNTYTDLQRELYIQARSLIYKALDLLDRAYRVGKYKEAKLTPLVSTDSVTIAGSVTVEQKVNDDKLSSV